ncbi:hypothetical protein HMPREF3218_0200969 [Prevotella bivia]|uniref:Uncharacterized protein n=1 Tax=Prevotella bivia TaxID=28125 RepID=A0A137T183_9BACT|nr:hypothetical protein HMPREF3202_00092 [Prevotella bivia]KXU58678.1 hypothetical protein HMPREF3218_0200969 [Prevotella bivia]
MNKNGIIVQFISYFGGYCLFLQMLDTDLMVVLLSLSTEV